MLNIPGITVQTQIYESENSLVYRGIRQQDSDPLILKILKQNYPTPSELARYRIEYQITKSLDLTGVVKVFGLQTYQNTLAMSLEDFGGESLKHWMQQKQFTLTEFLEIAINITEALGQIHAANIIHKDINPANIVLNPQTRQLKIIDFGISTQLTRENPTLKNPNLLEGTLAYISPEQTGRMNRCLDYRTDFYSLGVTFYQILTNQLPFETEDPLELVHWHIAKPPLAPNKLNPEIPLAISAIVIKLLAKTAEERYQSAWGIKADLEQCWQQFQETNKITEFFLASQDIYNKFQIPQKLYGRAAEISALLTAFERVHTQSQIALIAGFSGIGKSALVQELYKPITEKRGYFIAGKFDQYQRNIPYSAVVSALRELIKQLLTESAAKLQHWQREISTALGINGQVIVNIIPELELIIGKQPAIPELGVNESQNRFNLVFPNFIKVFTQSSRPLAIFLDDLQWADMASLKLIPLLINASSSGLFLIGAYRDNEVSPAHPLMLTIDEIAKNSVIVERIFLSSLDLSTTSEIISDTLNCTPDKVKDLAQLVQFKTGGNPFFMNEFLKSLYTERLLEFDLFAGKWQWDLAQIERQGFTDNVVELMAGKIQKLPEDAQILLKIAACIGNQFELEIIGLITNKSLAETAIALEATIAENLVIPLGSRDDLELALASKELLNIKYQLLPYKFVHDRIQQAAYSLIPETDKRTVHQQIGKILLENTPIDEQEEKIFDVVNQLNFGIGLIANERERNKLAELNLAAGKKAQISTAYQSALNYLQVGIGLLNEHSWQQQYNLMLALYTQAAEVAYLNTNFDLVQRYFEEVILQAKTVLDKVKVYEVKIMAYSAQMKSTEAISLGLEILQLLGIKLPKHPNELNILWGFLRTKLKIGTRKIDRLIDLPAMTAPYPKAAMRILNKIISNTYNTNSFLSLLILLQQVRLSIQWGNASESAIAYAAYGVSLCSFSEDISGFEDIELGYQFGKLALKIVSKFDAKEVQSQTQFIVHSLIRHWIEPAQKTVKSLLENYAIGLENGDLEFAAYSAFVYCYVKFLIGSDLAQLQLEIVNYHRVIHPMQQGRALDLLKIIHQAVLTLLNSTENSGNLIGETYDEQMVLSLAKNRNDGTVLLLLYFHKFWLCYLFGDLAQAIVNGKLAKPHLITNRGSLTIINFYFYDSLVQLAVATDAPKFQRQHLIKRVLRNQKKIKRWANYCPQNHLYKYLLVEAEIYRVLGKDALAIDYYHRAIATAKENEYIHYAALAYELAGKFYLSRNQELNARAYMQEARYCYQLWGAATKVKDLEKKYPQFFAGIQSQTINQKTTISATNTGSPTNLDIATIMKASQAISGEIKLEQLLSSLMKILIENAGAEKGYLILSNQGKLLIEAEGSVNSDVVSVFQSISVDNCLCLCKAIVNYVARTKESVVLNDATREGKFRGNRYIREFQPKSILCVPLINQGELISIAYLENNLTTGAFTPDRLEVLKLLSSQAAISIKNAKLYTEVRQNESRLEQLNKAYERFVPRQFLQFLDKSSVIDVELGDQVQLEMSVLFCDIRGFTALSEQMTPEENFKFINSYLSCMEPAIAANSGFIDKYIGDAIMALFSGTADNAVKAGISMLYRLEEYNQERVKLGYLPIQNGIGINTGLLMLGTVGGQNRMDSTVISDAVNIASRVESLTKTYGVSLLITEQTYSRLTNATSYAIRAIDRVAVRGKSQAVTIYEVFDADAPELKAKKLANMSLFATALELYHQGKLLESASLLAKYLEINQGDRVAKTYWNRCQVAPNTVQSDPP